MILDVLVLDVLDFLEVGRSMDYTMRELISHCLPRSLGYSLVHLIIRSTPHTSIH